MQVFTYYPNKESGIYELHYSYVPKVFIALLNISNLICSPVTLNRKKLVCRFQSCRWQYIFAHFDITSPCVMLSITFVIACSQTEEDILLRQELEEIAAAHPDQFHLHYTLDRPADGWKYSKGFISADMISENLPKPADDTLIIMCGPPPMINFACNPNLDKLGYADGLRFSY